MKTFVRQISLQIAALVAMCSGVCGQDGTSEPLRRIVEGFRNERNIPGLAIAVVKKEQPRQMEFFGLADVENEVPVTAETFFRFASVSKAVTAVGAMSLVEDGVLGLDVPLVDAIPTVSTAMREVTLRHLLAHQSGLRHSQPIAWKEPIKHYRSLQARIDDESDADPLFDPGEKMSYTTFGYCWAGRLMEVTAGKSFGEIMQSRVFGPANMSTTQVDDIYAIIPHRAQGYFLDINGLLRNSAPFDPSGKLPGGGLGGTIEDLACFLYAVQFGDLLSDSTKKQMWTPQSLKNGMPTTQALGWKVEGSPGARDVYHTGSQPKVSSVVLIRPDGGCSIAILCNLEQVDLSPLARRVADLCAKDILTIK